MLASIRDYMFWQIHIPLILIMAVGWLWGGGWLLLRSLKRSGYPKRIKLGNCVLIMAIGGVSGVASAGVVFFLINSVGGGAWATRIIAAAFGLVVLVAVAVLVVYAMLDLTFAAAARASALTVAALMALTLVMGAAGGIPAYIWRVEKKQREMCQVKLISSVYDGVMAYQRRFTDPPESLNILVEKNIIDPKTVFCPADTSKQNAYFYFPARLTEDGKVSETLTACDLAGYHPRGRNVMFVNGQARWCDKKEFERLLSLGENKAFANALKKAEAK